MAWQGDPRTSSAEWKHTRMRILERDRHRCQVEVGSHRCGAPANQVDHVRTHAECIRLGLDPDVDDNLQAICDPHHAAKSAGEGVAERARLRAARRRPTEQHPGLVPPNLRRSP